MALRSGWLALRSGERRTAVVCASEFASRFFRPAFFEGVRSVQKTGRPPSDAEFLRFMLSDGAGAAVMEGRPNARGLSLRVEWIDLISYAGRHEVCMYAGAAPGPDGRLGPSWSEYDHLASAAADGAILLRQDLQRLDQVVTLGVGRYFELVEAGRVHPAAIDWMLCHYSPDIFQGRIFDLLRKGGGMIPEERWFTNLYTKGNTGSASIFIMLEELVNQGRLEAGQTILCMVPESSRFLVSYLLLTAVDGAAMLPVVAAGPMSASLPAPEPPVSDAADLRASLTRRLGSVWLDFESRLNAVPIVDRLNRGRLRIEDYRLLLLNLRQQVAEGARWIARAASSITLEAFPLRSPPRGLPPRSATHPQSRG